MPIPQHISTTVKWLRFFPLSGHYNRYTRINVGWYPVFKQNVENHPQHKPGYLHSLLLFFTSFILTSETAHAEESHPGAGSLWSAALPPENTTQCSSWASSVQAAWVALAARVSNEHNNWLHVPNPDTHLDRVAYSSPAGGFCADNNAFSTLI